MSTFESPEFECLGSYFFVPQDAISTVVLPPDAEDLLNERLPGRDIYLGNRDPENIFELYANVAHYKDRTQEAAKAAELIPVFMDVLCLQGVARVSLNLTACVKFHRDAFPDGIPITTAKIIPFPARPASSEW